MSKARVIHIIGKRPVGGVGTVLLNYQKHMDPEKVQMDYFIFGDEEEEFDRSVKALGSKVYGVSALTNTGFGGTKTAMENFFRVHAKDYDIVHLHPPYIAGIVLPIAKKYGMKHRIVHSHATVYAESTKKAIRNHALWLVSQGAITDRIGCSDAAGKFLFGKKPYSVMRNAIDVDFYRFRPEVRRRIREEEHLPDDRIVVSNVGRFSLQKNQTFLIDIYAKMKEKNPSCVLWLVGDGETRKEIFEKCKDYGFSCANANGKVWPKDSDGPYDVKFFGMVKNAEELYQAMDIMVMPSLFEGLPMVGVEAQASGLPVVFSDTITKEVDVVGCPYLSLEERPEIWAEQALRLQRLHDVTQRSQKSYNEELKRLGFNIETEAKRLEKYYLKML